MRIDRQVAPDIYSWHCLERLSVREGWYDSLSASYCMCEQDTETEKNLVFDLLSQPKGFNCTPGAAVNLRAGEAHTV